MGRMGFSLIACLLLLLASSRTADAALIINVNEVGSDVVTTFSGSIDLSGLSLFQTGMAPGGMGAEIPGIRSGDASYQQFTSYEGVTTVPTAFGPGNGGWRVATSYIGDANVGPVGSKIYVPEGYVSENPLSATMTHSGWSFASLGLTPGQYVWSWSSDSVELNIIDASVPEPGSIALLVVGLFGLGGYATRKRCQRS